jgi:hypothetical protein
MTPQLLAELSRLPLFPRSARDLIHVAGLEGAAQIITAWPGQVWPVPAVVGGGNPAGARRWGQLIEIVGEPVAARIVRWCPGGELFVPNLKEVLWSRTQDRIRSDFDRLTTTGGYSVREAIFELGIKHGCSGTAVQRALKRPNHVLGEAAAAAPVQTCLF